MKRTITVALWSIIFAAISQSSSVYGSDDSAPFFPTWKLLNSEQKQQFMAGYLKGWRDSAQITDIAIEYVEKNPAEAVSGLRKLKGIYDLSGVTPEVLSQGVDRYFADPGNQAAGLSKAVSAVTRGN
mgnify:CR=1 FL=1